MASNLDFPFSIFREVLQAFLSWSPAVLAAAFLGVFGGLWAAQGVRPDLLEAVVAVLFAMVFSILFPSLFLAVGGTLLTWCALVQLEIESTSGRAVALGFVFLIWFAVGAWTSHSLFPAICD